MSKSTVVRLFVGSLIGTAASVVLFIVAGLPAVRSDVFVTHGPSEAVTRGASDAD